MKIQVLLHFTLSSSPRCWARRPRPPLVQPASHLNSSRICRPAVCRRPAPGSPSVNSHSIGKVPWSYKTTAEGLGSSLPPLCMPWFCRILELLLGRGQCKGLTMCFPQDSNCLPHGPAELLVGHAAVFFLLSPQLCYSLRLEELEDPLPPVFPFHQTRVLFLVDQDVPDELPKVGTTGRCRERQRQTERSKYVFVCTCKQNLRPMQKAGQSEITQTV